jgi:hypothetical protein
VSSKLDVSIAEEPHTYTRSYSLRDIERLGHLDREEWRNVQREWRTWHRECVGFSAMGICLWGVCAFIAWASLFRTASVSTGYKR